MWKVEPGSIGPLFIGMPIDRAIAVLGPKYDVFKRVPEDVNAIYAFDEVDIHLTCNPDGMVVGVSVFRPRSVSYANVPLLGRDIELVAEELVAKGVGVRKAEAGYFIEPLELVLVDIDGIVDGVELFR